MIFGGDKKAYDEAISEHLPDDNTRKEIEKEISTLKRLLVKYNRDKELILDKVLNQNLNSSIIEGLNQRADDLDKNIIEAQTELQEKKQRLSTMMTVEEYKEKVERIYEYWQRVYTGWAAMEDMSWENRKYLIDLMFDGVDENGHPYGVYVRNVEVKVFEYEIYGRFTVGAGFMKKDALDYRGAETQAAIEQWWDELQDENCTKYSRKEESYGLRMGGTGLEPVASCV